MINSDDSDAIHLISGIPDHAWQTIAVLESGKHARPYMESFVVYGENACYEWQMEEESFL